MRCSRIAKTLRRLHSCQPCLWERSFAASAADASLEPSTSGPSLPITLRELQGTLHPPQSLAISALDAQLTRGKAGALARRAELDDLLTRYVSRSSQPTRGQMMTIRLLQRYNGAMPGLRGQTILAKVLSVSAEQVIVDTGFHGLSEIPRVDLTLSHIHTRDGAPPPTRTASDDIRPGDLLRLRLDAYFTPYGDMQLTAVQDDLQQRRRLVWDELRRRMDAGEVVSGRILNDCPGGFAVGVAGFVARLPAALAGADTAKRVGVRQDFLITAMDTARKLITLRDPSMRSAAGRA